MPSDKFFMKLLLVFEFPYNTLTSPRRKLKIIGQNLRRSSIILLRGQSRLSTLLKGGRFQKHINVVRDKKNYKHDHGVWLFESWPPGPTTDWWERLFREMWNCSLVFEKSAVKCSKYGWKFYLSDGNYSVLSRDNRPYMN